MEIDTISDVLLRLLAAVGAGMLLGANRDLSGKPMGARTLGLVALGAAVISVGTIHIEAIESDPDALSRVIQGIVPGVLTGIGFLGAGVVIRDRERQTVHGLTTAATVWVTAALGVTCALAAWPIVLIGLVLALGLLLLGHPAVARALGVKPSADADPLERP
ncbi:MAG: MgtC/SapB family protein [Alphaproteobacteria bacterium]|nr:MgtC/SapB family protein [Alphaproteobacteria bacterium]